MTPSGFRMTTWLLSILALAAAAPAAEIDAVGSKQEQKPAQAPALPDLAWSKEVAAGRGSNPLVKYQATLESGYLVIKAEHQKHWHTYAMDNEVRAKLALKGKKPLGIESGIAITVKGLELDKRWLQSEPKDFSRPELRWYTFGHEGTALFACKLRELPKTDNPVGVKIVGQACSGDTCRMVKVSLVLEGNSLRGKSISETRWKSLLATLVPMKQEHEE